MCQNGTLEALLDDTGAPPFPHRVPSVSPPCPLPTRPGALSVPFWHSSGCPRHPRACKRQVRLMGSHSNPFSLTRRGLNFNGLRRSFGRQVPVGEGKQGRNSTRIAPSGNRPAVSLGDFNPALGFHLEPGQGAWGKQNYRDTQVQRGLEGLLQPTGQGSHTRCVRRGFHF